MRKGSFASWFISFPRVCPSLRARSQKLQLRKNSANTFPLLTHREGFLSEIVVSVACMYIFALSRQNP